MEKTRTFKELSLGDAAVEGLLNGILAGIVMAVFVLAVEVVAGVTPESVLGYFDGGGNGSPLVGAFTHIAISGIYGVVFGLGAMVVVRLAGMRMNLGIWLLMGVLFGLVILGIAEWVILPRTNSPLLGMPVWAFGIAHGLFGLTLGWLTGRNK